MTRLELSTKIPWGDKEISELEFQPLKAKHIRGLSAKPGMGDMLDLVSKSTAQPMAFIDELSAADALRAVGIIGNFLQPSQEIGQVVSE